MPLPRPCVDCERRFQPHSKSSKKCEECSFLSRYKNKSRALEVMKEKKFRMRHCKKCRVIFRSRTPQSKVCDSCTLKNLRPGWKVQAQGLTMHRRGVVE